VVQRIGAQRRCALTNHASPFRPTIRNSPFAIRYLLSFCPFAAHCSPLAVFHHSPFAIRHSLSFDSPFAGAAGQPAGRSNAAPLRPRRLAARAGLGPAPTSTSTIRHSRFAVIRCSLLAARHSPLAIFPHSPFAIRHSLFAVFSIRHSPSRIVRRPMCVGTREVPRMPQAGSVGSTRPPC
jgi:hypothetical protein